jgi:uncharacterized protein (DUF1684 family)
MTDAARPGLDTEPRASLSLADYRRRVADLYAEVRSAGTVASWNRWRQGRDELFRTHSQSAVPEDRRAAFSGLPFFPYDPALRFTAEVRPAAGGRITLSHSAEGSTPGRAVGTVDLEIGGIAVRLTLFRLRQYGDHLFLPFRDATNGAETYGGGRYLLDTAKGADLGGDDSRLVLDFNYAYHPSCVHDSRWSCPLSPPGSRLTVPIRAGERLP